MSLYFIINLSGIKENYTKIRKKLILRYESSNIEGTNKNHKFMYHTSFIN